MVVEGSTEKGWVRDGILSALAKGPRNSSEMARELGVSKATVSYHTKSLVNRGLIEISDVRSIKGGVYSKTFALKPTGGALARKADERERSLARVDELFEKLLMSWHLNPQRAPADEVKIFLYHVFRLLAEAGSLDGVTLESYGVRVGEELISTSLRFESAKEGLKQMVSYLGERGMADMRLEFGKKAARIACSTCFENSDHGTLVCDFTKGMIEGTLREKLGERHSVSRATDRELAACIFSVRWGRSRK